MKKLNWHNPEHISEEHLNSRDGWRFLLREELDNPPSDTELHTVGRNWVNNAERESIESRCYSYRTREPLPEWARSSNLENQPDGQEGWIKWSDRAPTKEDLPVKCAYSGESVYEVWKRSVPDDSYHYWMHDDTPPIPPRELTQEEKDEIAADSAWMAISVGCEKSAFKAGYMAGISQGRLDNLSA